MANTMLLAQNTWDLVTDAAGNIAMASNPYAPAQDVASACRVFLGELWYDTSQGVPYFERILGRVPNPVYISAQEETAALTVPEVATARCVLGTFNNERVGGTTQVVAHSRVLTGQVQITLVSGTAATVALATTPGSVPWYVTAVSPQAAGSPAGGP